MTFISVLLMAVYANAGILKKSQTEEVKTPHLVVRYHNQTGILSLTIPNENQINAIQVKHLEFLLNGKVQKGFSVINSDAKRVLQNKKFRVVLSPSGKRSVSITWDALDHKRHKMTMRIIDPTGSAFYGSGERFNSVNQRGYILPVANDDHVLEKGVGSYATIPFLMSSQGYGLWVDNTSRGKFDIGGTDRNRIDITYNDSKIRIVFIGGPKLKNILKEYVRLTGKPHIPPKWAFGFWKSRDVFQNRDSVLEDVHKLRKYNIPASVIVFDSPWETGYNNFEINKQQFSQPEQLFKTIKANGFYSALWFTPMINSRDNIDMHGVDSVSGNYREAAQNGYLIHDSTGKILKVNWWKGTGGVIDFTNPKAVKWWLGQIGKTRKLDGVRAFKLDDGEGNYIPNADYYNHTEPWHMPNEYAALYHKAVQMYIDSVFDGDGVLLNRSGFTGAQRFPFLWAGDNSSNFSFSDGLPTVIVAGQNAGLSGIPFWGSDISGYLNSKKPSRELFVRWTQFGALSPFMQVHMTSNLGPWNFGRQVLSIFRRYAMLHTDLLPYIYNAALTAQQNGMPIIRAMELAFQNDPEAGRHRYQYMFGPDLLVAPMYRSGTWRSVYIPKGKWVNYWTGNVVHGPVNIEDHVPLSQIPLFVRYGSIIPMLPENIQTLVPRNSEMKKDIISISDEPKRILQIWPGDNGHIINPNGIAANYEKHGSEYTLTITNDKKRPVEVHFMYQKMRNMGYNLPLTFNAKKHMEVLHLPAFKGTKTIMLLVNK